MRSGPPTLRRRSIAAERSERDSNPYTSVMPMTVP